MEICQPSTCKARSPLMVPGSLEPSSCWHTDTAPNPVKSQLLEPRGLARPVQTVARMGPLGICSSSEGMDLWPAREEKCAASCSLVAWPGAPSSCLHTGLTWSSLQACSWSPFFSSLLRISPTRPLWTPSGWEVGSAREPGSPLTFTIRNVFSMASGETLLLTEELSNEPE